MKKIIFFTLASAMSILTFAQQKGPAISWDETSYDFGTIQMEDGTVTHTFTFVNTGDEPLVLTKVQPSCGCTAVDYTKEPVAPGSKGFVEAAYNPTNRPGPINKSITVTTNEASQAGTSLRINGHVNSGKTQEQGTELQQAVPDDAKQLNQSSEPIRRAGSEARPVNRMGTNKDNTKNENENESESLRR